MELYRTEAWSWVRMIPLRNHGPRRRLRFRHGLPIKAPLTARRGAGPRRVLYSFGGDLRRIVSGGRCCCRPQWHTLYGTTRTGGTAETGFNGDGTVFELKAATRGQEPGLRTSYTSFSRVSRQFDTIRQPPVRWTRAAFTARPAAGERFYGVVFKLQRPSSPGGAWTETVLHTFTGGADSGSPYQGCLSARAEYSLARPAAWGLRRECHDIRCRAIKPAIGLSDRWLSLVVPLSMRGFELEAVR